MASFFPEEDQLVRLINVDTLRRCKNPQLFKGRVFIMASNPHDLYPLHGERYLVRLSDGAEGGISFTIKCHEWDKVGAYNFLEPV